MNALKRFSGTKSKREEKHLISLALEHFLLASALTLHEDFGFGRVRIERYVHGMMPRMEETIDRYGDDCFLTALQAKCKEIGIEIEMQKECERKCVRFYFVGSDWITANGSMEAYILSLSKQGEMEPELLIIEYWVCVVNVSMLTLSP